MRLIFSSKKRGKLIIKMVLLLGLLYIISLFISQRTLISNKEKKIREMKDKISAQEIKISEIKSDLDAIKSSDPKYMENIAHKELKLLKRRERVFINAKGN